MQPVEKKQSSIWEGRNVMLGEPVFGVKLPVFESCLHLSGTGRLQAVHFYLSKLQLLHLWKEDNSNTTNNVSSVKFKWNNAYTEDNTETEKYQVIYNV